MSDTLSDCAQAYLAEYGTRPQNRDEQDRYSAFRFGFEAGQKQGRAAALRAQRSQLDALLEVTT